jgi:hypothetical protein
MMSGKNQIVYNKISDAEEEIDRIERNLSVLICATMPVALAIYVAVF